MAISNFYGSIEIDYFEAKDSSYEELLRKKEIFDNKVTENVHVRKVFAFLYTYIMNLFPPHHHHDCLQMRYEYSCAKSVAPLSCYNTYTSSNDDGGGDEKLEFLDRHNVKCRSDEVFMSS